MPISEKTVELNVSRTVIEKMRRTHQINAYSIGATQAQEKQFGFDVMSTDGFWCGGLIQYKRKYAMTGGVDRWNLNRTTHRDQHSLLCALENAGFPVFYCFPKFDSELALRQWTPPSLWKQVWWVRPMAINVPAPVDDHHHVTYNNMTGVWQVFSESGEEFDPGDVGFSVLEERLLALNRETHSLARLKETTERLIAERWIQLQKDPVSDERRRRQLLGTYMGNVLRGLGLIAYDPLPPRLPVVKQNKVIRG